MNTLDGMTTGTWTLDPAHTEVGFSVRHAAARSQGSPAN